MTISKTCDGTICRVGFDNAYDIQPSISYQEQCRRLSAVKLAYEARYYVILENGKFFTKVATNGRAIKRFNIERAEEIMKTLTKYNIKATIKNVAEM